MTFLKEWTFSVCTTLVIAVVFSLFTPKGRMKDFYKIIISLFIFISFLYPFKSLDAADFDFSSADSISSINDGAQSSYEESINTQVKSVLTENGINGADVSSRVSFDMQSGEITVESVQIAISDEYNANEVENLVFEKIGINAKVIYVGQ